MNDKTYLSTFLDQAELDALGRFLADPVAFQAVKKVCLAGLYRYGVLKPGQEPDMLRNGALGSVANESDMKTDEMLGQDLRAYYRGLSTIETSFNMIATLKETVAPKADKPKNPAR